MAGILGAWFCMTSLTRPPSSSWAYGQQQFEFHGRKQTVVDGQGVYLNSIDGQGVYLNSIDGHVISFLRACTSTGPPTVLPEA